MSIILYSIKDKDNLADHNSWSGTDYLRRTAQFISSPTITRESNSTFSSNGDYSLKITSSASTYQSTLLTEANVNAGETYDATIDILTNTNNVELRCFEDDSHHNTINISASNNVQTVSISRTMNQNGTFQLFYIIRQPGTVYIDNVRVNKR